MVFVEPVCFVVELLAFPFGGTLFPSLLSFIMDHDKILDIPFSFLFFVCLFLVFLGILGFLFILLSSGFHGQQY